MHEICREPALEPNHYKIKTNIGKERSEWHSRRAWSISYKDVKKKKRKREITAYNVNLLQTGNNDTCPWPLCDSDHGGKRREEALEQETGL